MSTSGYTRSEDLASWQCDIPAQRAAEKAVREEIADKRAAEIAARNHQITRINVNLIKYGLIPFGLLAYCLSADDTSEAAVNVFFLWLIPVGITVCLAFNDIGKTLFGGQRMSLRDGSWYLGWAHALYVWAPIVIFFVSYMGS